MGQLRVRNWDTWQTYRRDRGQPPYIKVHRRVLLDPDFILLSDVERGHLMLIWVVAADRNGVIPDDALVVQRLINSQEPPDLEKFLSLQFLEKTGKRRRQSGAKRSSLRRRSDTPETETETETKAESYRDATHEVEVGMRANVDASRPTPPDDHVPDQHGQWVEWLVNERGWPIERAHGVKVATMLRSWCAERVTVGEARIAVAAAHAKQQTISSPAFYAGFVTQVIADRNAGGQGHAPSGRGGTHRRESAVERVYRATAGLAGDSGEVPQ